jgi:glucosamine--fructose-6-phosphate aminotransferase (isomerizing)
MSGAKGQSQDILSAASQDGPDEMGRELAEGPDAVEGTLSEVARLRPRLAALIDDARRVVLVGTGASLAMGRASAPVWRARLGDGKDLLVRQSTEAVLGDSDGWQFEPSDLVVAISQSGASPETVAAVRQAAAIGAPVLAITAQSDSPLATGATLVSLVASGDERGASTKSALATLAALLAIAGALPTDADAVSAIGLRLRSIVASWETVTPAGRSLADARQTWFLGFGSGLGIAEAGALLWHEKVARQAAAGTPSEFRHGPIEAAGAEDGVVLLDIDPPDPRREAYFERLRAELSELDVTVVELRPDPGERAQRALAALLRVQQLCRATALAAGTYRDGFSVLRRLVTPANDLLR